MLIFALLAAGLGSSSQTETKEQELVVLPREKTAIEQELVPPKIGDTSRHVFDQRFDKSPDKRSFMVITPPPQSSVRLKGQDGSTWLEAPEGWDASDLKTKPDRVAPLQEPAPEIRILRGGGR